MRISKQERLSKLLNKIRIRLDLKEGGLAEKKMEIEEVRAKYPAYSRALARLALIDVKENSKYYDSTDERYKIRRPDRVIRQGVRLYPSGGGWRLEKRKIGND